MPGLVNGHPPIVNEDVDYLVEDNAMDDICLPPELDGPWYAHFWNIILNIKTSEKGNSEKMTQR
jgi:hypothetical protein